MKPHTSTNKKCESCFMPLNADTGNSGSDKYCSYCYKDGKFIYEGDNWNEFQKRVYSGMREKGFNPIFAKISAWSTKFAPRWKDKK